MATRTSDLSTLSSTCTTVKTTPLIHTAMSTTPTAHDDPNLQTTTSMAFVHTSTSLLYAVTHVFLPVQPPDKSDYTPENDHSLARAVCAAAHAYRTHVCGTSEQAQWHRITRMLDNLQASVQPEHMDNDLVISQLRGMQTGDILAFFIRRQNAAIILTKQENFTLCEAFEVSPSEYDVRYTPEPLICSYPRSAVETPNGVFDDRAFQSELANFLTRPNDVNLGSPLPPPDDPQYANALFNGILQSVGADVPRVTKRVALLIGNLRGGGRTPDFSRVIKHVRDHIGRSWEIDGEVSVLRRSPLWLLIRVAIQMSVNHAPGRALYKHFMLFFTCTLARDESNPNLSCDLLHLMSAQILRRLRKLGSSVPDWLSELKVRPSTFRNPPRDELTRDTQLSLLHCGDYIRNALANPGHKSASTPFHFSHGRRGTIEDFLSSNGTFFDEAFDADPDVTLYDVQRSVEQGIDDWLARITNVDEACEQLENLMDRYMTEAYKARWADLNPEHVSTRLLTGIELYVALDKLVVKEVPMLADYPPEIPIAFLERLLLRRTTSLHRLSCAYQYLSARHSRSRPGWSVLLDEFTKDSFPVRYYDQFPHLQHLKARIEAEHAIEKDAGGIGPQHGNAGLARTHDESQESQQPIPERRLAEWAQSPLPALPLHAKVVVFELQCPACIRIWRSAAPRILHHFYNAIFDDKTSHAYAEQETWLSTLRHIRRDVLDRRHVDFYEEHHLLARVPAFQPYIVKRQGPPLRVQIHLAYFYLREYQSRNGLILRYVVQHPDPYTVEKDRLSMWQPQRRYSDEELSSYLQYHLEFPFHSKALVKYMKYTSHTSNDVLSAQADCPPDLSLDEFVAFGHLRSGGSLQWLNILQGLRSRTLNLRRPQVHYLLANAAFEVGPLDLNTRTWIWHQELQDPFFCNALIDELENLFVDVGASSMDGVLIHSILLLLTRVLASSPSEDVSDRAIALLRKIRRKTFSWVRDLSYDLAKAPTDRERRNLLLNMASTCRSTFDVDPDSATARKLLHYAEDVDALLSCAFFIQTLGPGDFDDPYSDLRLCFALEEILRDVILADVSDYGVDLAVAKIFFRYQPGTQRWEQLHCPNARWLTCKTHATVDQPSQTVHINLLDGALRVNGQPSGGLPDEIRYSPECQQIFQDQGFFVIPSSIPGMDFTTHTMVSEHKVHFSLRDDNVVVQVQGNRRNEMLELIPSSKLEEDLPAALVDGHVHWLNLSTQIIEIRPLEQLWEESAEHWRINCALGHCRMYRGNETLVDIGSQTWEMVSKCFECLNIVDDSSRRWRPQDDEDLGSPFRNLLVTIDSLHSALVPSLSVTLPRYGLSFFVNEREELESRDFKDMVYDENQCVGALFGLENLLVLRPKTHLAGTLIPEALIHRRVVIPNGYPKKHRDHRARIYIGSFPLESDEPSYHTYDVDTELGSLIGNGSLKSTRLLAYLHAMTSCHRPDPLTGKTGAQAALCLLQSAGCRSIMKLKAFDYDESWISTQYPQVNAAYMEIRKIYYWDHRVHFTRYDSATEKRAARRAAYLFPSNAAGPTSQEGYDESKYFRTCVPEEPTLDQLFSSRPAPEIRAHSTLVRDSHNAPSDDVSALEQLFSSLRTDTSFQREYLTHLDASAQHLRKESRRTYRVVGGNLIEVLEKHFVQCRTDYMDSLDILRKSLGPTTNLQDHVLNRFVQWSPITADVLLRYLASTSPIKIPQRWKECLTSLALLLLNLQRARRLLCSALYGPEEDLLKELENEGCEGWNPEQHPDWLLIQVQGNFLIRRAQAEIAREMISPESGANTVLQVNMGEGKSSVIIPIVAAALANGEHLVRVVVPKALTVQMFELLVSRLGGLTNRPIYHLPFSRTPEYEYGEVISLQIDDLHRLMSQCMAERGILLVQPEHVLSLKLMNIEEQIREGKLTTNLLPNLHTLNYKHVMTALSLHDGPGGDAHDASDSASKWLSLQKWLHSHVRDILDESDEVLHTRFQLVYTMGTQQHMDGYPDRWTITQQVLRLVKKHVYSLSSYACDSIEYERGPPGSFPHVLILQASHVGPRLKSLIVEDVMAGQLLNLNFQHIPSSLRDAIRSFIADEDVDVLRVPDTVKKVEEYANGSKQSHLWSGLLLLRGLLTSNILLFALSERRWRVDYGPVLRPRSTRYAEHSQTPTMLAVPYRAKDVPAPNTQFGHPDLTIILTCLSYYYGGLSKEQLRDSFEILFDEDDPSAEYTLWIEECKSVPDSLQTLSSINLRSLEQWDNVILPYFARNQAAIDFYLSRVVFPREAQEFTSKLSGSSWDLAEKRENLITGFSGTNDGRWLLPMSIDQHALDHQKGTNARVLSCLLHQDNSYNMVTPEGGDTAKRLTTHDFLRTAATQQPAIRVLLDVGSQILDLSNREVATAWLDISRDTTGAIYFNETDELMVLTKNGITAPMLSSPLSQQLDRCVVYLDHEHTRGTDIKLPIGSRAAVTLGPKVTKDALVQGCMRMRKLGHGHSVMFFAPHEIDRSIRALVSKNDPNTQVTTVDILCWAIQETWNDVQQRAPYWAQQGMSHKSRYNAWSRFCNNDLTRKQLSDVWLQPEQKSLTNLYAPRESNNAQSDLSVLDSDIQRRCKDLGVLSLHGAQIEEEQEREVNRQREREREVELPPRANPVKHYLDPAVVNFVKTGVILSFNAFRSVFTSLEKNYATTRDAAIWSPLILATADFCTTIQPKSTSGTMDQYHRPVQWILSGKTKRHQILVLLSPFEADLLMPDIRASKYVRLHMYAPRTSQRMKPSDDLQLYSIPHLASNWTPPWALIDQLNVFAGQLYLRDYESYIRLCRLFGIPATKESRNEILAQRNLSNIHGSSKKNEMTSGSPLPFVQALLAIRRRGLPFAHTHMGKILQGQFLTENDFQR
ncbi:hypothetical protein OG21DRAFT_1498931 [Imleria badia]|nr:hypothetical protein OG21DRAFT_1498931 [Imleria badia]